MAQDTCDTALTTSLPSGRVGEGALFETLTHQPIADQTLIAQSGSNRQYYRLTLADGSTLIGTVGTSVQENRAFVTLARHLKAKGLNVPEVVAVSPDCTTYLQSDLGDVSLFDVLKRGREAGGQYDEHDIELLKRTIRMLPHIQVEGAENMDFSVCYPQPEFDRRNVMFDLNYFKYCFLKPSGVDFNEQQLEDDFEALASTLLADSGAWGFMIRDFQARNVMLVGDGTPYLIDFQGGRRGPLVYDLVSFLWQASAQYPDDLKTLLIDEYIDELEKVLNSQLSSELCSSRKRTLNSLPSSARRASELSTLNSTLPLFVLFRTLQVLGAYGYRGYFERKKHFIDSIPFALRNLATVMDQAKPWPHLHATLKVLITTHGGGTSGPHNTARKLSTLNSQLSTPPSLHVKVYSFGYKHGIPQDESGNGGGYVFDCRAIHNPGRYDEYKQLTGLDEPVIRFLEDDGEITRFLTQVYALADAHVTRYIERGFTNLMFCFGCTGGQHRSVYCAQHLAQHIHSSFGIKVTLCHREQGITTTLQ